MKNFFNKKTLLVLASIVITYVVLFVLTTTQIIKPYYTLIIVLTLINIILAVSLNLIVGFTGQLCLGHAGFMAIGAYVSAILTKEMNLPFLLAILVGAIVSSIFAAIIGYPTLRLKGDYFAITTLAFCEIIKVIIMNIDAVGGATGLKSIPKNTNFSIAFIFAALTILIIYNILHSSHGRAMITVRENEIAAESMGINTFKYKMMAFITGAFFAGLAGALYAHHMGYLQPSTFNYVKSIDYLTYVVFGGMGSLSGSILATGVLTFLPELLRSFSEYRMIIYPLALIVLMIFRPKGLLGNKELSLKLFKLPLKFSEKSNKSEGA